MHPHYTPKTIQRFWSRVNRSGDCWLWLGRKARGGYGQLDVGNKAIYAHRMAYELTNGTIPEGLDILHRCDTPSCVRPDHLWAGTHNENMHDMVVKGRSPRMVGEHHHQAKLTWDQVRAIRVRYAEGHITQTQIADEYGIDQASVSLIVRGKIWQE